jgi:hypothetical protein
VRNPDTSVRRSGYALALFAADPMMAAYHPNPQILGRASEARFGAKLDITAWTGDGR